MWRSTFLALAFLVLCPLAFSQSTTVSGVIQDADGQAWFGGTYSFAFKVSPSNPTGAYYWNGAPFNVSQAIKGSLDGSGSYSVSIPSNSSITPAGSSWDVTFCPLATAPCYTQNFTITGASQTVGPTPPGIRINMESPPPNTRAYLDAEMVAGVLGQSYYNISDTLLHYCATAPCGWTVITGGGSGVNTYTVATLPASPAVNTLAVVTDGTNQSCTVGGGSFHNLCQWNGSTWTFVSPATASSTVGTTGQIQKTDGSGNHVATNLTETGTQLTVDDDMHGKGPNPSSDATRYHVRAINPNTWPRVTVPVCTATSTSIPVTNSGGYVFQVGDGVMFPGCGATHSMVTPTITSLAVVLASGGMNTGYVVATPSSSGSTQYCIVDALRDTGWGMTAGSAETCISNGPAALGPQTPIAITGCLRTLNVTSCTVADSSMLAPKALLYISGTSDDPSMGGFPIVNTVPDGTHFTYINGMDARNGGTVSTLGGTATYYYGLHAILTNNPTGAYEHILYEGASGAETLKGASLPTGLSSAFGTDPGYLTWDYWGTKSDNQTFAPWVPTTPPGSAISDSLDTTIVSCSPSCSGTGTMVVANAPSTTYTPATAWFDNAPNIRTMSTTLTSFSAGGGSYMNFPFTDESTSNYCYGIASYTSISSVISYGSPLCLYDTLKLTGNGMLIGNLAPNSLRQATPAFGLQPTNPIYSFGAYPALWVNQLKGVGLVNKGNAYLGLFMSGASTKLLTDVNLSANGDGLDCIGTLLYLVGDASTSFGMTAWNTSLEPGPSTATTGQCIASSAVHKMDTEINYHNLSISERGMTFAPPSYGLQAFISQGQEMQSSALPEFVFMHQESAGTVGGNVVITQVTPDTAGAAIAANWSTVGALGISLRLDNSHAPSSGLSFVTGKPFNALDITNSGINSAISGDQVGQNVNVTIRNGQSGFSIDGNFSSGTVGVGLSPENFKRPVIIAPANSLFTDIVNPVAPTIGAPTSGGSIPVGTHTMTIHPVYYDGTTYYEGKKSFGTSFTTTSGNQTVAVSSYGVTGAAGYDVYVDGSLYNTGAGCSAIPQVTTTSGFTLSAGSCGNSEPSVPGGGPVHMNAVTLAAQVIHLPAITTPGAPTYGANLTFNPATNKLACTYSGGDCSPSPTSYVSSLSPDSNGFSSIGAGSTGPVTLTLNNATGYAVWGNPTSGTAAPNYTALTSWPAAAFPTLNQNTTGYAGGLSGCPDPTAVAKGSVCYSDGTQWRWFAGNTGSTAQWTEDGTGTPSWGSGMIWPGTVGIPRWTSGTAWDTSINDTAAKTGQTLVAVNGSASAFASPAILDSTIVTSTPYTIACDTSTAIVDRAHTLPLGSGASVVTVPDSTATGCSGMALTVENTSGSTVTFNRSGSDTFTILDGSASPPTGQTSFTLTDGQYATMKQGASHLWRIEKKTNSGVGSIVATSPLGGSGSTTVTLTCSTCVTSPGTLTAHAILVGNGGQSATYAIGTATLDASGNMSLPGTFSAGASTVTGLTDSGLGAGIVRSSSGGLFSSAEISGDCTTSGSNAITCTKTNGSAFVASATTDTTNAANISSGTLPAARLPNPSASTLGGIESLASVSHKWINTISTSGVPSATQPACGDLSDAAASCNTDATNASNIASGTLSSSRLDASTVCIPGTFASQTDGATVTWAIGSTMCANASLTFTTHGGSRTLNLTGMVNGGSYVLKIIQDGTGGEGLTLGTGCTWKVSGGGSGAITPSTSASAIDVLAFTYDGTNCYANFNKNFN